MSTAIISAAPVNLEKKRESIECKQALRIVLYFRSRSFNSVPIDEVNSENDNVISLEELFSQNGCEFIVTDDLQSKVDIVKTEFQSIKEDTICKNRKQIERVILNLINKHCVTSGEKRATDSPKLIVRIYVPYYGDDNFMVQSLVLTAVDKIKKTFNGKVDFENSGVEFCQLNTAKNICPESRTLDSKSGDRKPKKLDVQICAMLSHYVYYYEDWLEAGFNMSNYEQVIKRLKKEKTTVKSLGEKVLGGVTRVLKMFTQGQKKVMERVINRLYEIGNVVGKSIEENFEIIKRVIEENPNRPLDFFEVYNKFGYWDYIKKECPNLAGEAKLWHVCHPYSIYNKDKYLFTTPPICRNSGSNQGFIVGVLNESNESKTLYYNTILIDGMDCLSGYGAALFVRTDDSGTKPEAFVYGNKGTDVNSGNDWVLVDLMQAFTGFSLQHVHAVKNAITVSKAIDKQYSGIPLIFCGHSLGGGLASSCAIATPSRHAVTFNAAGLNFIGGCWTRLVGAASHLSYESLRPLAIAERVYPIRISGEAIDVLMFVAKALTLNLNERAYGRTALVLRNVDLPILSKHGINNFLYNNIMRVLGYSDEGDGVLEREKAIDITPSPGGVKTKKERLKSIESAHKNTRIGKGGFIFDSVSGLITFSKIISYFEEINRDVPIGDFDNLSDVC